MQGETVVVRVFGTAFVLRKIWSVGQRVVYVTDEKNYDLLQQDQDAVVPIGVPKEDVYKYVGGECRLDSLDVDKLTKWKESSTRL